MSGKHKKLCFTALAALVLAVTSAFYTAACGDNGDSGKTAAPPEPKPAYAVSKDSPLSGMVAIRIDSGAARSGQTSYDNIADYVKALVRAAARGNLPGGFEFPLKNATTDAVRQIPGLSHNVVVKWLDPLTADDSGTAPRYGANNDYIAYFGEGWDSDWAEGRIGSAPQFSGSSSQGWIWSNHEYVSNEAPMPTSAPTGQHLTLARFLRFFGILTNDVESDVWSQPDLNTYIRNWKKQVGGSWMKVVRSGSGWGVDTAAGNRRYDATSGTLLRVTGFEISPGNTDDRGRPLPRGVVAGINSDCSGGQTPWGTVITAEENVQYSYGDLETCWTSRQVFVPGEGFDPGANISPTLEPSTSSDFGSISNPAERNNRDYYGFLVEIDPGQDPANYYESVRNPGGDGLGHRKIGSMGRARWENVTFAVDGNWKLLSGKKIVMYAGNDRRSGRVYKWVSKEAYTDGMSRARVRALLDEGDLYVAHFADLDNGTGVNLAGTGKPPGKDSPGKGKWIRMSVDNDRDVAPNAPALGAGKKVGEALKDVSWNSIGGFPDDNFVKMALFTAANKIGVMELNRPEDLEWNPKDPSGSPRLYVVFTKNGRPTALRNDGVRWPDEETVPLKDRFVRPDPVGSIFVVSEENPQSPEDSLSFTFHAVFVGTEGAGPFDAANPDNAMIDRDGGVWFGTDGNYGKNGTADALYYLDLDRSNSEGRKGVVNPTYGKAFRIAAGPSDSEVTGPAFNSNMDTVFLNIQHPGEEDAPSSWPRR